MYWPLFWDRSQARTRHPGIGGKTKKPHLAPSHSVVGAGFEPRTPALGSVLLEGHGSVHDAPGNGAALRKENLAPSLTALLPLVVD